MKKIETGTVVLLKFPFADGVNYKRRPALVLKDFQDGDILVCRITSKIYKSKYDIYLRDWQQFGLKLSSVVRVHKMATLEKNMIETTMGQIDQTVLTKVKLLYMSIPND
ncbi:MAG: type II toxin-antitoxin system PemK/MazF family toxin [Bacteroidales bacterium]|jgi:mRNA interferase MazF|nr:type II toxin-antitoxin system PemK/MazF family toxin [Bacteroidales bacterium]